MSKFSVLVIKTETTEYEIDVENRDTAFEFGKMLANGTRATNIRGVNRKSHGVSTSMHLYDENEELDSEVEFQGEA